MDKFAIEHRAFEIVFTTAKATTIGKKAHSMAEHNVYKVTRNKQHSEYIPSSKASVFILNLISCGGLTQVVYGVNRRNNGLTVVPFSLYFDFVK